MNYSEKESLLPEKQDSAFVEHDGVIITPSYVRFTEGSEGITCKQTITMKNRGNRPAHIRIRQPISISFEIKKADVVLYPGFSFSTTVTYTFKQSALLKIMIPIEINKKTFDYRVICTIATEHVTIDPVYLDFGTIDVGYSSRVRTMKLINTGGKSAKFSIDFGNNPLRITVTPKKGVVKPSKPVTLRIELISTNEGVFYEEFWIQTTPNIRVPMKVNAIAPRFAIRFPKSTGDFTLIDFSSVVENTHCYRTFVVQNCSSRSATFIVQAEIRHQLRFIEEVDPEDPVFQAFKVQPTRGRMNPFESRIFEVSFQPNLEIIRRKRLLRTKRGSGETIVDDVNDFVALLHVTRVHCVETDHDVLTVERPKLSLSEDFLHEKHKFQDDQDVELPYTPSTMSIETIPKIPYCNKVSICVYGTVEVARLLFEPDVVYFGEVRQGESSQRVVRLTNPSKNIKITFKFDRPASVRCTPLTKSLEPEDSVEVLVKFYGRSNLRGPTFQLHVDLIADSWCEEKNTKIKKIVGRNSIECHVHVYFKTVAPFEVIERKKPTMIDNLQRECREFKRKQQYSIKLCHETETAVSRTEDETLIPLTPFQIYNICVTPNLFDFGKVAQRSISNRSINAENRNDFPVMLRWKSPSSTISFPKGEIAILNPRETSKLPIQFQAGTIGRFNGYIDYVINDHHTYELGITADVAHKQLSLTKHDFYLDEEIFKEEAYHPLSTVIEIKNELNAKTHFKWEVPAGYGYTIEPPTGFVSGHSGIFVFVQFTAEWSSVRSIEATMKCEGTADKVVRITTPLTSARAVLTRNDIDFADLPLNLPKTEFTSIKNLENVPIAFEVDFSSLVTGIRVHPVLGVIPPRGTTRLEITVSIDACCDFSTSVRFKIYRNTLTLRLKGSVKFPRLAVKPDRIDARRVSLDAYRCFPIVFENTGSVDAKLEFDLTDYPEFRVTRSSGRMEPIVKHVDLPPGCYREIFLHVEPIDLASYTFYLPVTINDISTPIFQGDSRKSKSFVESNESRNCYINNAGFTLTTSILNLPTVFVNCTVRDHVAMFSKLVFEFDTVEGYLKDELTLKNPGTTPVNILIRIDDIKHTECPFTVNFISGSDPNYFQNSIIIELDEHQSSTFSIEFVPKNFGAFDCSLPIFVRGQLDGKMFNILNLRGQHPEPRIDSENRELFFPPLATRTRHHDEIVLTAKNFDETTKISYRITQPDYCCGLYDESILTVEFPRGVEVPAGRVTELTALVSFRSETPISFRLFVIFEVELFNVSHSVLVHATADDCLLSTYVHRTTFFDEQSVKSRCRKISAVSAEFSGEDDNDDELNDTSETRFSVVTYFESPDTPIIHTVSTTDLIKTSASIGNEEIPDLGDVIGSNLDSNSQQKAGRVSIISNKTKTSVIKLTFPYYPPIGSNVHYADYLKAVLIAAERWLYQGPLKFKIYLSIPDCLISSHSKMQKLHSGSKRNVKLESKTVTFLDVLENLTGHKFHNNEILNPKLSIDDKILITAQINEKMLNFLSTNGACLAHVTVDVLMNYEDYLVFRKLTDPSSNQLTRSLFEVRSKQCWLDVVLQTYKCFVLKTVTRDSLASSFIPQNMSHMRSAFHCYPSFARGPEVRTKLVDCYVEEIEKHANFESKKRVTNYEHCEPENILLGWLEHHYKQQIKQEWVMDKHRNINKHVGARDVVPDRRITNFESDLWDSLPLIAVTAAYCPFLIDTHFSNIYLNPKNINEALHNAICVTNAWKKIRLGFIITPSMIYSSNQVNMLMLVVHLFFTLPTYVPKTKVTFSTSLTKSTIRDIKISNATDKRVSYLLQFFNNESNSFSLPGKNRILNIKKYNSEVVQIEFNARKIRNANAFLLACGHALSSTTSDNQLFILEGITESLEVTEKFTISSKQYQVVDRKLPIKIPYSESAVYDIWMTEEQPQKASKLKIKLWSDLKTKRIPRRLFLNQDKISKENEQHETSLFVTVACIAPYKKTFWLVFQSDKGDFVIQITTVTKSPSVTKQIIVNRKYEENNNNDRNICNIDILIPSKNTPMWNCVNYMIQKTLDDRERQFWSSYLNTNVGLKLIRWLVEDVTDSQTTEFLHIFYSSVTYNVKFIDESKNLIVSPQVTISDVQCEEAETTLKIQVPQNLPQIYKTTLQLISNDEREKRIYSINLIEMK